MSVSVWSDHDGDFLPSLDIPAWQQRAACRGSDPELFFPDRGEDADPAKKICADCPVRQECLEAALARGERFGIWGGMSERERRKIRRTRRAGADVNQAA